MLLEPCGTPAEALCNGWAYNSSTGEISIKDEQGNRLCATAEVAGAGPRPPPRPPSPPKPNQVFLFGERCQFALFLVVGEIVSSKDFRVLQGWKSCGRPVALESNHT